MFIVKGKTSKSSHGFNTQQSPTGSMWGFQDKGWMTDALGEIWFRDIFLKHCGSARPQLLILDGHSSHETLAILDMAMQENIHILSLPLKSYSTGTVFYDPQGKKITPRHKFYPTVSHFSA
jgi:hypothetical protein